MELWKPTGDGNRNDTSGQAVRSKSRDTSVGGGLTRSSDETSVMAVERRD